MMIIEHDLTDGVGRLRLLGDLWSPRDVNELVAIVEEYVGNMLCSAVDLDLSLVFKISPVATGALTALTSMAANHSHELTFSGAHGRVRTALQRAGVLARPEARSASCRP
jgi:hypothetical protein